MMTVEKRLEGAQLPTDERELWLAIERALPRNWVLFVHPSAKDKWVVRLIRVSPNTVLEDVGMWSADTLLQALALVRFSKRFYNITNPRRAMVTRDEEGVTQDAHNRKRKDTSVSHGEGQGNNDDSDRDRNSDPTTTDANQTSGVGDSTVVSESISRELSDSGSAATS